MNNPNKYPGVLYIAFSFAFAWGIIGLVTWKGNATDSLHQSSLSWSYALIFAVLLTYGISDVMERFTKIK